MKKAFLKMLCCALLLLSLSGVSQYNEPAISTCEIHEIPIEQD